MLRANISRFRQAHNPYSSYTVSGCQEWQGPSDIPKNRKGGLAKQLEQDGHVVGRLDYSDSHASWVTDRGRSGDAQSIAQMVAATIKCMACPFSEKVITVGHSMGGLAIQAALADPGAADHADGIVSVATPWRRVPKDKIDHLIAAAQLARHCMPIQLRLPAQFYIDVVKDSSALRALGRDGEGGNPRLSVRFRKYRPASQCYP